MPQDNFDRLQTAVDDIARFDDRQRLARSPFHLSACGGCGAPAFKQPCSLCGYYPHGTDRGPKAPASFDAFAKMIEKSGPNGQNGTVATWHARSLFDSALWSNDPSRAAAAEAAAVEASSIEVPDADEVWVGVVTHAVTVTRSPSPDYVLQGWRALSEIDNVASGHYRTDPVRESTEAKALIHKWIDAVEADDIPELRACLEEGLHLASAVNAATRRKLTGNIHHAIDNLRGAIDKMPEPEAKPQPNRSFTP